MNNLKSRKAFIVGLSSTKITNKERLFLRKYKPWGVILFARNIKSVDQTKKLTNDIKKIISTYLNSFIITYFPVYQLR